MNVVHKIRPEIAAQEVEPIERLSLAFAPLHKRAMGGAIGLASAVVVMAMTMVHVIRQPDGLQIDLLRYYFYGYEVSWKGVLIGGFWAFIAGFVAGWFVAFCRNFVIAVSVFLTRARAELQATRDFLDHI